MTELHIIRTAALTVPCPYRLPDTSIPRSARRRRGGDESGWSCGAGVGEACRDPRTGQRLGKLPHVARTAAALAARRGGQPPTDDLGA